MKIREDSDIFFMKIALLQAEKSFKRDEIPVGALIVAPDNKTILSKAHNLTESKKCQSAHAEILAIEKACKKIGDWRLNDCSIFVTLEPCAMCMNLILLSKISKVVFAAKSKLFGFSLDKYNTFEIYKTPMLVKEGICAQNSIDLLKLFFKDKRKKSE